MTVTLSEQGMGQYRVRSEGHANTPEVCAVASALIQTLQGWIHTADMEIDEERISSGDNELCFTGATPGDKLRCHTAYEMAAIGFLRLQATAPEQIKVIISARSKNNADTGGITRD